MISDLIFSQCSGNKSPLAEVHPCASSSEFEFYVPGPIKTYLTEWGTD